MHESIGEIGNILATPKLLNPMVGDIIDPTTEANQLIDYSAGA